jgi:hypothetical protein
VPRTAVLFLWVLLAFEASAAGPAADTDSGPLRSIAAFFSWRSAVPPALRSAVSRYEEGRPFAAIRQAARVLDSSAAEFHDDAHFIGALSFEELGWPDLAARSFVAVLERQEPSPYYPLAVLGLVEGAHAEGRSEAVVEAYRRYVAKPWKAKDRKQLRARNLFFAYGDLREGGPEPTQGERELLSKPSELAAKLSLARERPADRLLYLSGLHLFRTGGYEETLEALRPIAVSSPYFRYALYTSAQALFALGRGDDAIAAIRRLLVYPSLDASAIALGERAAFLHAQLLFETGLADGALREAGGIAGEGEYALRGRLLRAEICLETERPGLAVAYYREVDETGLDPRLETGRGLGLGAAYAALGDFRSAADALRSAAAGVAKARGGVASTELERLRDLAGESVRRDLAAAAARRHRIADGMRRVFVYDGPLGLRKLLRVLFTSHRNTVLGAPVYDVERLASGEPRKGPPIANDRLWADYLTSEERPAAEAALRYLVAETDPRERPLHVLGAILKRLEGRLLAAEADLRGETGLAVSLVERLRESGVGVPVLTIDAGAPVGPQVAEYRRRLGAARWNDRATKALRAPGEIGQSTENLVESSVDEALRRFLGSRDDRLRRLEYDLRIALSETLVHQSDSSPTETR